MGATNKICPNCDRKMKQQFIGLQHCKCGVSWMKDTGFFERTTDMKFCLERRKIGKKVKQFPVIRYDEKKESKPVGSPKKCFGNNGFDFQDETFFFIAGETSGGAPYGVTWEEMGLGPWGTPIEDTEEDGPF